MTAPTPDALRVAASALLGPAPHRLAVPCPRCGAPPEAECAWQRGPGPPSVHSERRRRRDDLAAAHRAVVDALVEWSVAVAAGEPARALGGRARARHRAMRTRAETVGMPAPVLPEPATVLAAAGAGAAR